MESDRQTEAIHKANTLASVARTEKSRTDNKQETNLSIYLVVTCVTIRPFRLHYTLLQYTIYILDYIFK
jgi:hypothetical protein